jgi:hypothetical protein
MDVNNNTSSISKSDSLEKMGEFWDSHDFVEFDTDTPDVKFEVTCAVPVEIDLFAEIEKQARQRGVSVETLVNLWLQQKMVESLPATKEKYNQRAVHKQVAEKSKSVFGDYIPEAAHAPAVSATIILITRPRRFHACYFTYSRL